MMISRLIMILMCAGLFACEDASETLQQRPNIVFMVVEDLGPRIGAFGDALAATPNLDRLASEGIRYRNVFATAGVCAPARAALITGMYQQSIGAQHMRTSSFGRTRGGDLGTFSTEGPPYETVPPPYVKAFPELLRAAGYFTINDVKTDYQFGQPFTVWDVHEAGAALRDRDEGSPFFAMYSNNTTHESGLFRAGWANKLENSAALVERNTGRLAVLDTYTDPADVTVPGFLPDTLEVRKELAQHYDNVQLMDRWVGERLAELEMEGLLDNTIVVWTTDHGDGLPRAKRSLYDSGLHVPMIIRFPDGRGAGSIVDDLISFVDFAPTFLNLAKASVPDHLHGRDFLDDGIPSRTYIHAARDRIDEWPDRSRAVRDHRFKYIRNYVEDRPFFGALYYRENLASMAEMRRLREERNLPESISQYFETPRPAEELYDLSKDPDEIVNLASDPRYENDLMRLRAELDRWTTEIGDMSEQAEVDMVTTQMWPGGVQPETGEPIIAADCSADDAVVTLSSPTVGASIGYRIAGETPNHWHLYSGTFHAQQSQSIEARAIRYGYRESEISRKELCQLAVPYSGSH